MEHSNTEQDPSSKLIPSNHCCSCHKEAIKTELLAESNQHEYSKWELSMTIARDIMTADCGKIDRSCIDSAENFVTAVFKSYLVNGKTPKF